MLLSAAGLILADDRNLHLSELTRHRAFAAVPFAGRYRLIDFALSNLVNSGISRVGVATSYKYKSLMDHLGTGSSWDLDRRHQGLHILPPYLASDNYYDEGDDLRGVLDFLEMTNREYILVAESNNVFSMVYGEMFDFHKEKEADITILYNYDLADDGYNMVLDINDEDKVNEIFYNPPRNEIKTNSLGVVLLKKDLLEEMVSVAISKGLPRLTIDLILKAATDLNVFAFEYHGTALRINTVNSYFSASMDLLDHETNSDIFWSDYPVYTKVKDEAPVFVKGDVDVSNSVISDGSAINGGVKDSVVFRSVTVGEGSEIEKSILGQGSTIGKNVKLSHVILDKDCVISDGTELKGDPEYPVLIGKGAVI